MQIKVQHEGKSREILNVMDFARLQRPYGLSCSIFSLCIHRMYYNKKLNNLGRLIAVDLCHSFSDSVCSQIM